MLSLSVNVELILTGKPTEDRKEAIHIRTYMSLEWKAERKQSKTERDMQDIITN